MVVGVLALLAPGLSRAESVEAQERIEALYRQGRSARDRGDRARALELLREAWQLRKTHDGAASLAQVEFELGLKRDAAEHLAYALEHLPAETRPQRVQRLRDALDAVRREIVTLSLHVDPKAAEVGVNGEALGPALALPPEIFAEPGRVVVSASLNGYATGVTELAGKAGDLLVVQLTLQPSAPAPSAVPIPPPESPPREAVKRTPPRDAAPRTAPGARANTLPVVISATAATLAFGAGIGALLLARDRADAADERLARLPGDNRCGAGTPSRGACEDVREQLEAAKLFRGAAYGAFAGAAVGAAATVWFWSRPPRGGAASAVRITPLALGAQALVEF